MNRLPLSVLVLTSGLVLPAWAGTSGPDLRHDPILEIIDRVSETQLEANVQRLQDFGSRHVQSDSIMAAGQWIHDRLSGFGYTDVVFDTLSVLVYGDTQRNVLATKPGITDPGRVVVIGSHYDSYAYFDPAHDAPGADDNGSGVSAVLETARLLADIPLDATVLFAAWTAEEVGLVGSADWVERAYDAGLGIELYMNLDACGYLGDPAMDVDLLADAPSVPWSERMLAAAQRYTTLTPEIVTNIDFSDHASFRDFGYPFTYSLEGEVTPFIHTPNDLVGTIDFPYMREIVRMNIATLLEVAGLADHDLFLAIEPGQTSLFPGDTLRFDARLVNGTGGARSGDLWFSVATADSVEQLLPGAILNLPSNPMHGTIPDGGDTSLRVEVVLPGSVDPGAYLLIGRIGTFGGGVIDEDAFGIRVR